MLIICNNNYQFDSFCVVVRKLLAILELGDIGYIGYIGDIGDIGAFGRIGYSVREDRASTPAAARFIACLTQAAGEL